MINNIGERIKELRIKNNMTQNDLASVVGLTATGISYWESGKANPDIKSINKLADYFNVSIDYIYGKKDISESNDEEMEILFRKASELKDEDKEKIKSIIKASVEAFWDEESEK